MLLDDLAQNLVLGSLLEDIVRRFGTYELRAHWQQGEFHHDVVIELPYLPEGIPGKVLVVSTNCNGGVKELLVFDKMPDRRALWAERCNTNPPSIWRRIVKMGAALYGLLMSKPKPLVILGSARTVHWFNPCELLGEDARSELKPEFRKRQDGGGWESTVGGGCKPQRRD